MSLIEFLQENDIPFKQVGEHHHATQGWVSVDCPRCSPGSGRFRLGIAQDCSRSSCWSCGYGKPVDMLAQLTDRPSWSILDALAGILEDVPTKELPLRGKLVTPNGVGPLLPAHKKYLCKRGFDPDELTTVWGIQGIGIAPRLSWRLFIPIVHQGKTVSWTTRALHDRGSRYFNARPHEEAIRPKELLFGLDFVRHAAIICEGPFDAMRIGPGAVATMGIVCTKTQESLMSKIPLRIICMDAENDAQRRARKLVDNLSVFPGRTMNVVLDSKDPGDATKKEISLLRRMLR